MTKTTAQTNSQTLNLHCAVYAARPAARADMETSPLARNFIAATQEYQVSLLSVASQSQDYWSARGDFERAVQGGKLSQRLAEEALVYSEDAFCQIHPALSEKRETMLRTGRAYMKSQPELALTLDLPKAVQVWNHVKLLLKR